MITTRKESMSPNGFLRLIKQDDGDIIVCVAACGDDGKIHNVSTVEFCTPFSGGGGSSATYYAMIQLMGAMAADNLDPYQAHRRGEDTQDSDQEMIRQWAANCRESEAGQRRAELRNNESRLFRKRPVVIEARQIDTLDYDELCDIVKWCGGRAVGADTGDGKHVIAIDTDEGTMYANNRDWVIKGVKGEFYPCKPDVFEALYDAAAEE